MIGGIDKNILYKGKDFIDKELDNISWLISQGGYIPHIDHSVPPNSTWKNFVYYRSELNRIIDDTRVLK
jgi:uroporphyrinogen decarboxylase